MASIQEIIGVGTPPILARMLGQNRLRTILAEGSSQADANPLTVNFGTIGTSAPGQGVRLGYARAAALTALFNLGPDSVLVYPAEGDTLNDLGADLAITVPAGNLLIAVPSMDHWLALSSPGDLGSFADAPADGGIYAREDGAWVPAVEEAPEDGQPYVRAEGDWVVMPVPPPSGTDAPLDGLAYGRTMGDWAPVAEEAPEDGGLYGRDTGAWVPVPPPGIAEAPEDGTLYGRQSLGWAPVPPPGIAEAPADAFPYQRYGAAWTRLAALFPAMFGAAADGSDATAAMQAGLDAACNLGLDFVVAGGAFSVSGLVAYSGMTLRFVPGASLKFTGSAGPCICTSAAPGAGPPAATTITGVRIIKAVIDLQGRSGTGILLDDCAWASVEQPTVLNTGAGSWTYNSSQGPTTVPDGALAFHATNTAAQAYYNEIVLPHLVNAAAAGNQGVALWCGCPIGVTGGFPNYNKIDGGTARGFLVAVQIDAGSDFTFENIDVSHNTTAYLIGAGGHIVHRTRIVKPYCEHCSVGIHIAVGADRTFIEGAGGFGATVTPILEDPGNTNMATQYVNLDTPGGPNQLFPINPLGGAGMWGLVSGAGGFAGRDSGLAIASYDNGWGGVLYLARICGIPSAKTPILNNFVLGQIVGGGWDGAQLSGNTDTNAGADIMFQAAENWSPAAHGSRLIIHLTAPGTIGPRVNALVLATTGLTLPAGAAILIGATNAVTGKATFQHGSQQNPAGTASTTQVMMGIVASITPRLNGAICVTIAGSCQNSAAGSGGTVRLAYGTGSAPANGAALTGTLVGSNQGWFNSVAGAPGKIPFSVTAVITGLVAGSSYWLDAAVAAVTGGTATIGQVTISAFEP